MAKFTLIDGTEVEHTTPAITAQVWNRGKWNNLAVFDYSDTGWKQAELVLGWISDDIDKQICRFF